MKPKPSTLKKLTELISQPARRVDKGVVMSLQTSVTEGHGNSMNSQPPDQEFSSLGGMEGFREDIMYQSAYIVSKTTLRLDFKGIALLLKSKQKKTTKASLTRGTLTQMLSLVNSTEYLGKRSNGSKI